MLNPINYTPLAGKRSLTVDVGGSPEGIDEIAQNKYPLGGSPLYDLDAVINSVTQVTLTMYADGREIFVRMANPDVTYRMPSGFKAHTWQFKLTGNSDIYSFAMAETPKELESV